MGALHDQQVSRLILSIVYHLSIASLVPEVRLTQKVIQSIAEGRIRPDTT